MDYAIDKNEGQKTAIENDCLKDGYKNVLGMFDRSGAVDIMELKQIYRDWNSANLMMFDETDDIYLALVDDFLTRCGNFESFSNGTIVDRQKKEEEMEKSIDTQRLLINSITECTTVGVDGNILVTNSLSFNKVSETMGFLDDTVNKILSKDQFRSTTLQASSYLSGLKSMICASILARGAGYNISFGPVKYDIRNDLDMLLTKGARKIGLDVTTKQFVGNSEFGFSFFFNDKRTAITSAITEELKLTNRSKLYLPPSVTNPEYYDTDHSRSRVGFPAKETILNFRRSIP